MTPTSGATDEIIIATDTHIGYKMKTGAEKQWEKTAPEIAKADGDFVLHLGDIVYPRGRHEHYSAGFFRPLCHLPTCPT